MSKSLKKWLTRKKNAIRGTSIGIIVALLLTMIPASASNVTYIPVEDDYLEELVQTLGDSGTDLTIYVDTPPVYSPTTTDTYAVIEPGTARQEVVLIDSYDGTANTFTVAGSGRGQDLYLGDVRTTKIFEHPAGSEIMISDNYLFWQDLQTSTNTKLDNDGGNPTTTFDLDLSGSDFRFRLDGSDMKFTDGNQAEITLSSLASLSGSNDKLKITSSDTTEGYLQTKINARGGLAESVGSPAGDETYILDVDLTADVGNIVAGLLATVISDVSSTAAELNKLDGAGATVTAANLTTITSSSSSDADALHTHSNLGGPLSMTAGEAIDGSTTPVALGQIGDGFKDTLSIHLDGTDGLFKYDAASFADLDFGDIDGRTWMAQSFTYTDAGVGAITVERLGVWMSKTLAPTDNVTVEIQGNSTNKPDKSTITNGTSNTFDLSSLAAGYSPVNFTWSTPPTLTANTKYWFVFKRSIANDAANYPALAYENADNYASHGYSVYTASTTTWSAESTPDLMFHLEYTIDGGGKVYKLESDRQTNGNFIGFTTDDVAADAAITVSPPGVMMGDFTGLSPAYKYLISATAGSFSTTGAGASGNALFSVGKAYSATEMLISDSGIKVFSKAIAVIHPAEAGAKQVDLTIPTGFKPYYIRIHYSMQSSGATNNSNNYIQDFIWTTGTGGYQAGSLNDSFQHITATSSEQASIITTGANDYVLPVTIYENAVKIRCKITNNGAYQFSQILIEAYGY